MGAVSRVPCDRCDGSGKRAYDTLLEIAPGDDRASRHRHHSYAGGDIPDGAYDNGIERKSFLGHSHPDQSASSDGGLGRQEADWRKNESTRKQSATDPNVWRSTAVDTTAGGGGLPLSLTRTADCAKCGGSGKVPCPRDGSVCPHCSGERFVEETIKASVYIPPGADEGHTEVLRGKGNVDIAGKRKAVGFGGRN